MHRINAFFKRQEVDEIGVYVVRSQKLLALALVRSTAYFLLIALLGMANSNK